MRLLWYVSRRSQPSTASPEVGMAFLISKWARMPMTSQVNGTKNGCIMKNFNKIFFAAVAAAFGLASCSQELTPVEKPQGNLVTVNFGAEASIEPATKATLITEDELTFKSAWENGDIMSVKYSNGNEANGTVPATWNASSQAFEATLPEYTGMWDYNTVYPAPDADGKVDFGSVRTQKGNAYNSNYDLMKGAAIAENAAAGKDDNGKNIIFEMTRQTAVAYFHLTGTLDEEVVSAKLSVEGDGAYISTSDVKANDYAKGYVFTETEGVASKEINLTFGAGTAPKASDFKLWFNVLPTIYTKMTLTVETANHTMTISRTAEDMYEAGKLYKVVKAIPAEKWIKKEAAVEIYNIITSETELEDGNYVICMALNSDLKNRQYLGNEKGTKPSTKAIVEKEGITISADLTQISVDPTKMKLAQWSFKKTTDGFSISSCSDASLGLGTTASNDGLTIQNTYFGKSWIISFDSTVAAWKLKYKDTGRFLNVYSLKNPRTYTNETTNANGKIFLYKEGTPKTALETPANLQVSAAKVISWDAVSGAASYELTIGENTFTSETNSYDAAAVADEYYDVAVVAVPSDKENYKNSAAATLSGAKFGTPKLITPELAEGAIDESSIRVNMAVDARATNGCTCEIYNGETLVESKPIKQNYVVFSGLESGVTYTIKINAIAVEGEKPYAASDVASIELKTKATQHVSDVTKAGTYTIKGLTVYAVPNPSNAIVGDGTGFILLYKSSHGLKVGDTFNVAGTVKPFNGVWEFDSPSINGKAEGGTPVYPEAVEADEVYLSSYGTTTKIEYVHAKGIQSGQDIKVGTKTLYLSAKNAETDGKNVEVTGFVYGYNTKFSSASFVATSIGLDDSFPYLSVDQSSKVWAADATDAFVVKVTVNAKADWTVTPETLSWATIVVDKTAGTITVTPNGTNTAETANEAKLTVAHASETSLTKEITLKQNAAGGATGLVEYVSTFTDKELNTKEKTMTWTSSIEANSFEARGVQFGAKKGQFTITGTGHTSNVKKISVIISTNYAGNTISATVGGVAIGKQISLTKANNYEIVFESTTELSGDIVFNVNDKDKSVYIKSITVNPSK